MFISVESGYFRFLRNIFIGFMQRKKNVKCGRFIHYRAYRNFFLHIKAFFLWEVGWEEGGGGGVEVYFLYFKTFYIIIYKTNQIFC